MGERNTNNSAPTFSSSVLELFKTLSVFAHDETLIFPVLLQAIRSALPLFAPSIMMKKKQSPFSSIIALTLPIIKFNTNNCNNNLQSLRFGFWNASGLNQRLEEVKEFISDQNLDILMIQETFLRPGLNPSIQITPFIENDRDNTTTYRTYGGYLYLC
ncbi:hypothetical protein CEXT_805591 [Caerostris extrusa]|uniref:Endonuclease/exonuclease/phosphatase domain-containing protein n=1 Tax=Caerostris extrusa TaxID=172846 RepID=A0AAV4WCP7_CAEEX|nr:hypothetical protein CEXT_805591 [Caerostris extrusa]